MNYLLSKNQYFVLLLFFVVLSTYSQEIEKSIFITGNTWDMADTQVLSEIAKAAEQAQDPMLLLLGNAVPKENFKAAIDQQLKLIEGFKKDAVFLPGNQEWVENGFKGVNKIEKYIQKNSKAKFYPDNGTPVKHHNLGENIVLITIDSQWFLENWNDHPYINEETAIKNRTLFFLEFENRIKKAQGKIKIVAIHHPIHTNTRQGFIGNVAGPSEQDFQNNQYRKLRNRLQTIARSTEDVIFVSGHDQNLQYLYRKQVPQIISGAAGDSEGVRKAEDGNFTSSKNGYARLDIDVNGKVSVHFFTVQNRTSKPEFNTTILKGEKEGKTITYKPQGEYGPTQAASIYRAEETERSGLYNALWGKHYRDFYGTPVNVPVVFLDTLMGGLSPVKRGGGQQSKSLRLQDKNGKQFVMRALRKSTAKFLQSNAFQETYIGNAFDGSGIDKFLLDFYTTSPAYTPFAIDGLAEAIDVFHTNTALYYIPKQGSLGVYNDEFGDELYMIEEHVGDTQTGQESFGKPKEIISTADLLQEVHKSGKSDVDEPSYIRARVFDMLLGDWDRHEDQWRWSKFKNDDGTKSYKPIPRDRDQAFSKYDGALIKFLTRSLPALRKMQSYDKDLRSVKWFAASPYHLDLTLINDADWAVWEQETKYIQENLTDVEIEKAFSAIPDEIQGAVIEDIKVKLKGRRANLMQIAKEYYNYLNRFQVVVGTQKADDFKITRMANGETSIDIHRKDHGLLNRTFSDDVTREIWIYGLDGKDTFTVEGDGNKLINLKIVGGQNNDTYDFKNPKKVKFYDHKTKKNTIASRRAKKWMVDDYGINNYDQRKVRYHANQIIPIIGFNPDDGLRLGLHHTHTFNGLQRNPFTRKHVTSASYYTGSQGFDVSYKGEFSHIFHNWNFGLEGLYTSPNFAINYFGDGNETTYDKDEVDLDFNRTRIGKWSAALALIYRGRNGSAFHIKPLVESFEVENTEDRFVNDPNNLDPTSTVFEKQVYGGAELAYEFKNRNSLVFPTLGIDLRLAAGYKTNIDNTEADNGFTYLEPEIALTHKLTKSKSVIFATKLGGKVLFGDDFEFYHGAQIGGVNGLRGFRNERFVGKQSFYQNTDLRISVGGIRKSAIPVRLGITGSFDYGRVWVNDDNSNIWHNSYGGSLWSSGIFTTNIGYYQSTDGGRFVFGLGFTF